MSTNGNAPAKRLPAITKGPLETEEDYARRLFEAGDMGLRPGQPYPVFHGSGEYAQRWHAVMGSCEEEHLFGREQQLQSEYPERHIRKLRRRPRTTPQHPKERLIDASQFREAYSAIAFANSGGAVLNTHVTLNWSLLGIEDDTKASATFHSGVKKHMRLWFQHKNDQLSRPFAFIYVHERSGSKGLHTHLLVFIPFEWRADFKAWLLKRMARVSRQRPMPKEAVHVVSARKDRPLRHQWRLFGYLMKSVDPRASIPVFPGSYDKVPLTDLVPWAQEGPGQVKCKLRIGIAREIRASARESACAEGQPYLSLLDRGVTDVRLLFGDYDFKVWEWEQKEALHSELDEQTAGWMATQLAKEKAEADDKFFQQHDAWLKVVRRRDESYREAEEVRAAQLDAVRKLLSCGDAAGPWQPLTW